MNVSITAKWDIWDQIIRYLITDCLKRMNLSAMLEKSVITHLNPTTSKNNTEQILPSPILERMILTPNYFIQENYI